MSRSLTAYLRLSVEPFHHHAVFVRLWISDCLSSRNGATLKLDQNDFDTN